MNKLRTFLLTTFVCLSLSTALIYTSCNKATCTGIVCENNGTCSNGVCTCPSGFSGTFCETAASSVITFRNNTFTPVSITINGVGQTIPVGGTVAYTGLYGTIASGGASTSSSTPFGINTADGTLGSVIVWNKNIPFPVSDTLRDTLNVGRSYFFLRLVNNSAYGIIDYYVNYAFEYGSYYYDATIPNDGRTYDMGYYLAYSSSNVQTQNSKSGVVWKAVTLPFTENQTVTVTIP